MRRPVVGLSLLLAGGVGIGLRYGDAFDLEFLSLAAALIVWAAAVFFLVFRRDRLATLCIFGLAGLAGIAVGGSRDRPDYGGLPGVTGPGTHRTACTVEGVVNQDIMDAMAGANGDFIQFGLKCDALTVEGCRSAVSWPLRITLYGVPRYPPVYGERWVMDGTLLRGTDRRGGRDQSWRFLTSLSRSRRQERAGRSIAACSQWVRREAFGVLAHGVETRQGEIGVVSALLLGYRTCLPMEIQRSFVNTGTMHIVSISGLHVAILCSVLVSVIGLLRVPRTGWVFALGPVIVLYSLATGCRASAVRSGIMASAYLLAPALGRRPDTVSALALAGILILLWKPDQLTDIGCIFSFAAVAGILAMVPPLEALLQRWLEPDPLAVEGITDAEPWWRPSVLWMGQLGAVSVAAWIISTPLSLYYFGRFTPIALVANLLVIPLSFLIIVTGCLSLVAGACIGLWLAGIFNAANVVFVRLLTDGMRLLERVPLGHAEGWSLSLGGMMLLYTLLAVVLLCLPDMTKRHPQGETLEYGS